MLSSFDVKLLEHELNLEPKSDSLPDFCMFGIYNRNVSKYEFESGIWADIRAKIIRTRNVTW
jgi:hypothetical protein